jgi:hypothetical protein
MLRHFAPRKPNRMPSGARVEALESRQLRTSVYEYYFEVGGTTNISGVTASWNTSQPTVSVDQQSVELTLGNLPAHYAMAVSFNTMGDASSDAGGDADTLKVKVGTQQVFADSAQTTSVWGDVKVQNHSDSSATISFTGDDFETYDWHLISYVSVAIFVENDWQVIDGMEPLAGRTYISSKSGTDTVSGGSGSPGSSVAWTENYYFEDVWVQAGHDASGHYGDAAELDITKTYSQGHDLGAELGLQTPQGVSLTVSESYEATTGTDSHYGPKTWQDANSMFDATLYVRLRKVICVRTETVTGPTGEKTTGSSESIVGQGYVFGDHDWYVRQKTREPMP